MATLFVDKVDPQSGTSLEIGSSGDTITIPSGATITNNGTQTGFGGTNTPYFYAYQGSATSLANNAFTKVTMDNEVQDSAGAFSSSRFTVPSGQAGRYFFHFSVGLNSGSNIGAVFPLLFVNGAENTNGARIRKYHPGGSAAIATYNQSGFFNAQVGDYFEVFCYQNSGGAINTYSSSQDTFFFGYKLVE
jgi:hypothetical protein